MQNLRSLVLQFNTIIFVSLTAGADNSLVCENISTLTCTPGIHDDGTGLSASLGVTAARTEELTKKLNLSATSEFSNIVKDPKNKYFRKAVLSATRLVVHPDCKNADALPTEKCAAMMSQGLLEILGKYQKIPPEHVPTVFQDNSSIEQTTYVTDSPLFQKVQTNYLKQLRAVLSPDELERKIEEKIFPKVKELLAAKIENSVGDQRARQLILDKISAIEFEGTDCNLDWGREVSVGNTLLANAIYNPRKNTFKYCMGNTLETTSEFHMAYIITHELSHSIDPCGITRGPDDFVFKYKSTTLSEAEKEYPITGVPECLRDPKSAGARNLNDKSSDIEIVNPNDPALPSSSEKSPAELFCGRDQITESFADWMASEVTPDYIQSQFPKLSPDQRRIGYSNIWRGSCSEAGDPPGKHPTLEVRTNKIIFAQPKIRGQMGCPHHSEELRYCKTKVIATSETKKDDLIPKGSK